MTLIVMLLLMYKEGDSSTRSWTGGPERDGSFRGAVAPQLAQDAGSIASGPEGQPDGKRMDAKCGEGGCLAVTLHVLTRC